MTSKDVARRSKEAAAIEERRKVSIRAYQLRQSGMSWYRVAEELGITGENARRSVAELVHMASEVVDEGLRSQFLSMEVGRLDALQSAVWPDAITGDLQAIDRALKIIAERAKLLGLYNPATTAVTNNTIVVQGGTDEYIAALRRARNVMEVDSASTD